MTKRPHQREVNALAASYQNALREWGENNMETQRRWQRWFEARRARESAPLPPGS